MLRVVAIPQVQIRSGIPSHVSDFLIVKDSPQLSVRFQSLRLVLTNDGDLPGIRDLIRSFVPSAQQARLFGRELSFILPRSDVDK